MVFFHTRQSHVQPLESIRQLSMIDPKQVQDRSLQVVHVNSVRGNVVAVIIRGTV